jgi:hypothetical protein
MPVMTANAASAIATRAHPRLRCLKYRCPMPGNNRPESNAAFADLFIGPL